VYHFVFHYRTVLRVAGLRTESARLAPTRNPPVYPVGQHSHTVRLRPGFDRGFRVGRLDTRCRKMDALCWPPMELAACMALGVACGLEPCNPGKSIRLAF